MSRKSATWPPPAGGARGWAVGGSWRNLEGAGEGAVCIEFYPAREWGLASPKKAIVFLRRNCIEGELVSPGKKSNILLR